MDIVGRTMAVKRGETMSAQLESGLAPSRGRSEEEEVVAAFGFASFS